MAYAIKADVSDPRAKTMTFVAQKTMYGGKRIARGDAVYVFASENEGGQGLVARGVVTDARAVAKTPGVARQTPRVSVAIACAAFAVARLGSGAASSSASPTGATAGRRPSSTSSAIGRRRTRSSASRTKPPRFSTRSCASRRLVGATGARKRRIGRGRRGG